ncbi:hypothetical protein TSUD_220100 [Trifolium subterraneum]|uniref:Uncharacterized protein n=1 Tax=Trifolium subterraneum TaxID=3900 RepID=A0A2Z6N7G7_TRISU|nr:hypothetical protein TSUD_220100 [Trifolium subterraneum]
MPPPPTSPRSNHSSISLVLRRSFLTSLCFALFHFIYIQSWFRQASDLASAGAVTHLSINQHEIRKTKFYDSSKSLPHRKLKIDVVLSGGQAPGGHNLLLASNISADDAFTKLNVIVDADIEVALQFIIRLLLESKCVTLETKVLPMYGFGESAFACTFSELVLVWYPCSIDFGVDAQGELTCKVHLLAEGVTVKFGVTEASNNKVMYFKLAPFFGVRTTMFAPATSNSRKIYRFDHYFML